MVIVTQHANIFTLFKRVSLVAVAAFAVASCQSPPVGPPNYNDRYTVTPVLTNYVMATKFEPGTGMLVTAHEGRLQRFVRQFNRRGRSYLVIATTRDSAGQEAQRHMSEFKRHLASEGIDPKRIEVRPGAAPLGEGQSVVMSFRGYEAKVPECGDWSGSAAFNPGNLPHTNYGCSYQRNIGLMLSDPGELLQSRDAEQMNAERAAGIAGGFSEGEESTVELESLSDF